MFCLTDTALPINTEVANKLWTNINDQRDYNKLVASFIQSRQIWLEHHQDCAARLLNVLCTFNLHPESNGKANLRKYFSNK